MSAFELFQRFDQPLVGCGALYDYLSLPIDGQQLGTTRPPESIEVGFCIPGKICK